MHLFFKTLLASLIFIATQHTYANTFQVGSQSATGLSRAYAGEAVIADNASVMARNAAGMAMFYKKQMSIGWTSDTSLLIASSPSGTEVSHGTANNPNLYFIMPVSDNFSLGFDVHTNQSANTDLNNINDSASEAYYITELNRMNTELASSYRINTHWSLGVGIDYAYADGLLSEKIRNEKQNNSFDFNGSGVGFNLGTIITINRHHRFGLSFHYSPRITTTIDTSKDIAGTITTTPSTIAIPFPDTLEFSGYDKIPATLFAVTYSVQWVQWSSFQTKDKNNNELKSWTDGINSSIGWTYYVNTTWIVRSAYRYDWTQQNGISALATANSKRHWFAAGFTYQINKKAKIDFGWSFLLGQHIEVDPAINSTAQTHAILAGVQYSRSF